MCLWPFESPIWAALIWYWCLCVPMYNKMYGSWAQYTCKQWTIVDKKQLSSKSVWAEVACVTSRVSIWALWPASSVPMSSRALCPNLFKSSLHCLVIVRRRNTHVEVGKGSWVSKPNYRAGPWHIYRQTELQRWRLGRDSLRSLQLACHVWRDANVN